MHSNLLDLPVELQLKIIEVLLQDKDSEAHVDDGKKDDDDHDDKEEEPIKIYHDLISWSCTCSYFRNLLSPDIFKTVKLVNDNNSGFSLYAVAKSPHNIHVKNLHFIGSAPSQEVVFPDSEMVLPRSVEALLSDLQQFSSLESLSIEFDKSLKSEYDEMDSDSRYDDDSIDQETPEQVFEDEQSEACRALMSRTYYALMHNKSHHFKYLQIKLLIWKNVSTFKNPAFHDFLSHFEQFTLSISEDLDVELHYNVTRGYRMLMGKLDEYFFDHLANVTTLSIKAPNEGPLGLEGWPFVPLPLSADQMPLLTTLHLEYIFVSPELIDFLVGHKHTLEELTLRHCAASTRDGSEADNGIYWSQFFSSLCSACPTQFRRFELLGDEIRPSEDAFDKEEKENVRTILRQDPGRLMFPYAYLTSLYGNLFYDHEESLAAFLKGEDQRSWNQLMRLVEGNAKEATTRASRNPELQVQS